MKLVVATSINKKFKVDIDAEETVYNLKKQLALLPEVAVPPQRQNIMFRGGILKNDVKLVKYGVDSYSCLLVLIEDLPKEAAAVASKSNESTEVNRADGGNTQFEGHPNLIDNNEEILMNSLVSSGYPQMAVRAALIASKNNKSIALKILKYSSDSNEEKSNLDDI